MKTKAVKSKCLGALMAATAVFILPMQAIAVDFDEENVDVDGIRYGIVGTEAPYQAYVVETDEFDAFAPVYEGEITVPETIEFAPGQFATVVGIDNFAFYSTDITSVTLPNSVETIGKQAFGLCASLTCVKMGSGVKEIMSKAFFPDAKLTTIYIDAVEPPVIAADALMNNPASLTLYVPEGSVEKYMEAETWKTIGTIKTADDMVTVTEIVVTPATANVAEMGTLQLTATVYPAEAEQKVAWSSSDKSVASVSVNGEVFGVKSGTCVIYAMATDGSGVKGECAVTVGSGKTLEVNTPFINGFTGDKFKLSATVSPDDTTVEWEVKDTSIASVSSDGLDATVELLAPGNTKITVTASNGLSKEIEVTVKEMVDLTGIQVSPATLECEVGDIIYLYEFTVTPIPENASVFNPFLSIEDTSIIDYNPEDYDMESFECLTPGTTRFVWTQGEIKGYCTVVVAGEDDGINEVFATPTDCPIFSVDGIMVRKTSRNNEINTLPAGIYIINGKEILKRN